MDLVFLVLVCVNWTLISSLSGTLGFDFFLGGVGVGLVLYTSFLFQSHGFGFFGLGLCYLYFDFFVVWDSGFWFLFGFWSLFCWDSDPKSPDGFDPLNRWLVPPGSTRTSGRPRVHFLFTRFRRVGCGSTPNPIRPDPWTTLVNNILQFSITNQISPPAPPFTAD